MGNDLAPRLGIDPFRLTGPLRLRQNGRNRLCKLLIRYFSPTSMPTKQELRRWGLIALACLIIVACVLIATIWPPSYSTSPRTQIANSILLAGCRRWRLAERVIAEPADNASAKHHKQCMTKEDRNTLKVIGGRFAGRGGVGPPGS